MIAPYYDSGGITLYLGDCREILPELDRVDLVLTDPPYGIGAARNTRGGRQNGRALAPSKDYGDKDWDDEAPSPELLRRVIEAGDQAIVWGGNHLGLPASSCWLVWDKDTGANGYADAELAWTNLGGAVRLRRYRWRGMLQEYGGRDKEHRWHPTQKPISILRWAIELAGDHARTILDPFVGVGSTLRAAKDLRRRAVGIERIESYCEVAALRLGQEVLPFS